MADISVFVVFGHFISFFFPKYLIRYFGFHKKHVVIIVFTLALLYYILSRSSVPKETIIEKGMQDERTMVKLLRVKTSVDSPFFSKCSPKKLISRRPFIKMEEIYSNELKFDNEDGGVWKQGWNIEVKKTYNSTHKLKVFVVPHSHNDPGWKKTFEEYYSSKTKFILDNMVRKLSQHAKMKFIWAEVSFLSLWWEDATDDVKNEFIRFVEEGRIEIVTGGWVMTDEANSHYYSIIQQLSHGHRWLKENIGIDPKRSWCIDPFGVSPTLPFILKRFNLTSLVVQRTHYSVKKFLARKKWLEFRWRQFWSDGNDDMLTHMMPFYSYDVPHTCGPDPKICCQFDFKRISAFEMTCPWRVQPQPIDYENVAYKAELLLDQYRKKAELYDTNVLLVPLGDDFRYDNPEEWDAQYDNYVKLFDFMNADSKFNVQAQFGTLNDYFEALTSEKDEKAFPSLSGDFFTYADRDDHYWSGYYASRPFYKRMDRYFMHHLRCAEMLHGMAWRAAPSSSDFRSQRDGKSELTDLLAGARASLSLFQHHDGITGTAKDYVVNDYGAKLLRGILDLQRVMRYSAHFLLNIHNLKNYDSSWADRYDVTHTRWDHLILGNHGREVDHIHDNMLSFIGSKGAFRVVVFNSLSKAQTRIVHLKIEVKDYENVSVLKLSNKGRNSGEFVPAEIDPYCNFRAISSSTHSCYSLHFQVDIKPLELVTYLIYSSAADKTSPRASLSRLFFLPHVPRFVDAKFAKLEPFLSYGKETFRKMGLDGFYFSNGRIKLHFNRNGFLHKMGYEDPRWWTTMDVQFFTYKCKKEKEMCGAYLFLPDEEASPLECGPSSLVWALEGPTIMTLTVNCGILNHSISLFKISKSGASSYEEEYAIQIENTVNLSGMDGNQELVMRISTNIQNEGVFYTDLNGFQILRRKYNENIPLQGNYYPMPGAIYIEDPIMRLTVVSAQPLGASSPKPGQIEVLQDRRLIQDDNLGLGQGVTDNRLTPLKFRLLIEERKIRCEKMPDSATGYHTLLAKSSSDALLYPLTLMSAYEEDDAATSSLKYVYDALAAQIRPLWDIHVVSYATTSATVPGETDPSSGTGLILHRMEFDSCFDHPNDFKYNFSSNGRTNVSSFIENVKKEDAFYRSSLSFLTIKPKQKRGNQLEILCPMDLAAFYFPSYPPAD